MAVGRKQEILKLKMLRETQLRNALTKDVRSDEAGHEENKNADQRKVKEKQTQNSILKSGVVEHQAQILEKFESRKRAAQPGAGPK